jgi:CHAD domain-containing protein
MDAPLTEFAARVLRRRARKVLKDHEELAGMPVAVLHALRLRAKRLRYAAEFFAPLFPAKRTRRYLRRLAELQAALGEVNDCAVANLLVHDLPATRTRAAAERAWAQGAIEGFAASRATLARAAAEAAWRKLRDTAPFWVA